MRQDLSNQLPYDKRFFNKGGKVLNLHVYDSIQSVGKSRVMFIRDIPCLPKAIVLQQVHYLYMRCPRTGVLALRILVLASNIQRQALSIRCQDRDNLCHSDHLRPTRLTFCLRMLLMLERRSPTST